MTFTYTLCRTSSDYQQAKAISQRYIDWQNTDFSFQNIDQEFLDFESMYGATNRGAFIIVTDEHQVCGGVGLRQHDEQTCEMKRMFVDPLYQGNKLGHHLCVQVIEVAKALSYQYMVLDTVARLSVAIGLYEKYGFYRIPQYCVNPDPTAIFMRLDLT